MKALNYITRQHPIESVKPVLQAATTPYDMVVFCHLRWEFVYQRPQHIISRLSKNYKILFIEEPIGVDAGGVNTANLRVVSENLHVLQPKTTCIADIAQILPQYIGNRSVKVGWFYSSAFIPLLEYLVCDTIVYDCMDELTLFKDAESRLAGQEAQLLDCAAVVFTGGKSLYESKSRLHANVHCFPSSVDRQHFAKAGRNQDLPADMAGIKGPIAGYFGVIDERIDYNLLEEVAQMNPDISFVMIGPFAKINEAELPRLANIHYMGMKHYSVLPEYLARFDVAIMPFALNDATKFISPTKTLEYMAAGKPIISTPIKDVVRDYGHCVSIVSSAEQFSAALCSVVRQPPQSMLPTYAKILDATSWDSTVHRMKALVGLKVVAHESL